MSILKLYSVIISFLIHLMTIYGYFVINETYVIGIICHQLHKKEHS